MTAELYDIRSEVLIAELFCDSQLDGVEAIDAVPPTRRPQERSSTVMADAVIAQVIQLKDPDEPIPTAVWWRVAELLRACTTATTAGPHLTGTLVDHALAATDDVLSALSAHGECARELAAPPPGGAGNIAVASAGKVSPDVFVEARRACLQVARLMFSLDSTTPAVLASRVNQLRRALVGWRLALYIAGA